MHFGPWYPLEEAIERAPCATGIVQLRAPAIFGYARGLSAMVYYACSPNHETLASFMTRCGSVFVTHAAQHGARLIRFGESEQPERDLERLLGRFEARFGSAPVGNVAQSRDVP